MREHAALPRGQAAPANQLSLRADNLGSSSLLYACEAQKKKNTGREWKRPASPSSSMTIE